jgi:glycosyltransferase involved in cell wall biosynthesis
MPKDSALRTPHSALRVCFFGTYEQNYVRNRTLIDGLLKHGWSVQECHVPVWEKERNKTGNYLGPLSLFIRGMEVVLAYIRLLLKYLFTVGPYDIMMVGYIGHLDMPLAWLLTRLPRRSLVFSPLISLYDTLVDDRRSFAEGTLMSRFLKWLDRRTCSIADLILLDTDAHIGYFVDTFGLPRDKFVRVFVGADETVFTPVRTPPVTPHPDAPFRILFVGKFTPLHGLDTIIRAAALMKDRTDVVFDMIGSGQLSDEIHTLADQEALSSVQFTDWVEYDQLPQRIVQADVCLGIFGTTAKTDRVIPAKVFATLAMRKPLITGDSVAIKELLTDGENAVLCPIGDAEALSHAIRRVLEDRMLMDRIAEGGRQVYLAHASEAQIGQTVADALRELINTC